MSENSNAPLHLLQPQPIPRKVRTTEPDAEKLAEYMRLVEEARMRM